MTRPATFLVALAFASLAACTAEEVANQCDAFSELDAQVECLDQGFQQLRVAEAECEGVDRTEREHSCADRCDAAGLNDTSCRRACGPDGEEGRDSRPEAERDEERPVRSAPERSELDELHFRTRSDVERDARSRSRRGRIRGALRDGHDMRVCDTRR